MSPDDLADRVDGLVHRETQLHDAGVDLTVASVDAITTPARVDFGGGELTDVGTAPVETTKRSPDDDYGWWNVAGGTYLLEFNESLAGDGPVQLQPRVELVERGVSHPTLRVADLPRVPITVPAAGIQLKENARVSTLVPVDAD
ncbi:dCTP deaminase [Salinigranum sp. GCM10025319]|uniref:dCTP deaminase n=1 Tax=Salinigranum sp. GCM10025319 TaxID=3252687 RepID=UPI003618A370